MIGASSRWRWSEWTDCRPPSTPPQSRWRSRRRWGEQWSPELWFSLRRWWQWPRVPLWCWPWCPCETTWGRCWKPWGPRPGREWPRGASAGPEKCSRWGGWERRRTPASGSPWGPEVSSRETLCTLSPKSYSCTGSILKKKRKNTLKWQYKGCGLRGPPAVII